MEGIDKLLVLTQAFKIIFADCTCVSKKVAKGNKYCGQVYLPKQFEGKEALVVVFSK